MGNGTPVWDFTLKTTFKEIYETVLWNTIIMHLCAKHNPTILSIRDGFLNFLNSTYLRVLSLLESL